MSTSSFAFEDRQGWFDHIQTHGYAVVQGVLSPAECAYALGEFWSIMESLGAVRRNDARSLTRSASWPPMLHGGMIQYLGHTPIQWWLRERCAKVYSSYYDIAPTELATSFDGLCFMHGKRAYEKRGNLVSFLHSDQSPRRDFEWSIQGLITLTPSGAREGGLVVVPDTHREHRKFFEKHPKRAEIKGDWYLFSDAEKALYAPRAVKVCADAGDFLMWDSRTFHCNTVPETDAMRACSYVCMLPKRKVANDVRARRKKAYALRRTSNHHPGDGFRLFPDLPRFMREDRDAFLKKIAAQQSGIDETPLVRSLTCVD